jgi:IstB-like ATP binding protein
MRHNPAAGAVVIMLRTLKMHGMAQAVGELTEQGSPAFEGALPILSQLLKAETADREVRSTAYQLKAARFPNYRDLSGFDFASSEVNEALVRQLHRCEFLEDAHNVVLVGGPGTGKTHLATAIGVQAIEHHRASASSRPSNSSTPSNRRSFSESLGRSLVGSPIPTSSFSTNLAICRSAPLAGRCSSIC